MDRTLRLLIVDDSQDDADLLLLAMRRGGFAVTYELVDTLPAMHSALERQDWDVITSDHSMPRFSALEALALAKARRPDIPFIIVSGEIDLSLAVSLMRDGAWDYVQKHQLAHLVPAIERVLRDVLRRNDQRESVLALESSEIRYRRLFETAQDGILILDAETGEIRDVNPFLLDMLGYTHEQFLGKKLWEVGAFKDVEASKAAFLELQRKRYIRYENLPLEAIDGQQIAAEFVSNLYYVEKTKVIQCNIRDITSRREAETELRELNAVLEQRVRQRTDQLEGLIEELETFNYSVSHDMRAPLNRIDGFADHLQEDHASSLDAGGLRLIQRIRASAQGMNALIDALLELTRISRHDIRRQHTNLSSMAREIADELTTNEPARDVEFAIAEGISINGDAPLLRSVLENLLNNAWKFTAGRDAAKIEFGSTPQADGSIAHFVRDNGAGFDMNHVSKLFTAFGRLHSAKEFSGTGIGLATVQRIIHRHNGKVWAEGAVDQGATVYFAL